MARANNVVDLTIDEMWQDAQKDFRNQVGKDLAENANVSLPDLITKLKADYTSKDKEDRNSKIRKIVTLLQSISTLAAIAGAGTEDAFAGAKGCFAAVAFLLGVPSRINQFYENIADLFDSIQDVINQYKILVRVEAIAMLDPSLRENTHRMLCCFVRMVALSYKVLTASRWSKIKISLRAGLGDTDQGIQREIDNFEKLSKSQDSLYNSLNHELGHGTKLAVERIQDGVGRIQDGMDVLVNDTSDRKAKESNKELTEAVKRDLLGGEDDKVQTTRLASARLQCLPGTGAWLLKNEHYQQWRDHGTSVHPLLMISGRSGSGKTHLIPTILDDLDANSQNNKVLSAVYMFNKQDIAGKDSTNPDHPALRTALQSMAFQIAMNNRTYLKELSSVLQARGPKSKTDRKTGTLEDLWNQLRFASGRADNTYVLIFDGLEVLPEATAEALLSILANPRLGSSNASASTATTKLRILATGTQETLSRHALLRTIDMSESDNEDVEKYIDQKMQTDSSLKSLSSSHPDRAQQFKSKIASAADGDFSLAISRLDTVKDALNSLADLEDIDHMLDEPPERDHNKIAKRTLDELNSQLKPHDINQLNEVLKWIIYGLHPDTGSRFNIDQVDIISSVSTKKTAAQSFKMKIKDKDIFGRVLMLETRGEDVDEYVVVRPELVDFFVDMRKHEEEEAAMLDNRQASYVEPRITLTIQIDNAKPESVRRFLWDLSERATFDPFFFTAPLTGTQNSNKIHVNLIDSRATILDASLKLLCEEPKDSTNELAIWAMKHLPYHIRWAAKNFDKIPDQKSVVTRLIELLTEVDTTIEHWANWYAVADAWLDSKATAAVYTILQRARSDLVHELGPRDKRDLHKLVGSNGAYYCYYDLTLQIGSNWLQGDSWDVLPLFNWVNKWLDGQKSFEKASDDRDNDSESDDDWEYDNGSNEDSESNVDEEESDNESDSDEEEDETNSNVNETSRGDEPDGNGSDHDDNEDENENNSLSMKKRIARAAEWVTDGLGLAGRNTIWHARLGKTYMLKGLYDEALRTFNEVPSDAQNMNYTIKESKARALAGKKDFTKAVSEMNDALILLRQISDRTDGQQRGLIDSCRRLASWYTEKLDDPTMAADLYEEVLSLDPSHDDTYQDLFKVWRDNDNNGDTAHVADLLKSMHEEKDGDSPLSRLVSLFRTLVGPDAVDFFEIFFALVQRTGLYALAFEAFDQAIQYPEDFQILRRYEIAAFRLHKGILTALQDRTTQGLNNAYNFWRESLEVLEHQDFRGFAATDWAVQVVQHYHHTKALTFGQQNAAWHVAQLESLTRKQQKDIANMNLHAYLASYYTETQQEPKAKEIYDPMMTEILQFTTVLQSDDCANIAEIYLKLGNDDMALSAWSQCAPFESTLCWVCDGNCGTEWEYANDFWLCRTCPRKIFCEACLKRVKAGTLEVYQCAQDHSWLHVPAWPQKPEGEEDVSATATNDSVLCGGKIIEGTWEREGAEVLTLTQWLHKVQADWDIDVGSVDLSDEEEDQSADQIEGDDQKEVSDEGKQQPLQSYPTPPAEVPPVYGVVASTSVPLLPPEDTRQPIQSVETSRQLFLQSEYPEAIPTTAQAPPPPTIPETLRYSMANTQTSTARPISSYGSYDGQGYGDEPWLDQPQQTQPPSTAYARNEAPLRGTDLREQTQALPSAYARSQPPAQSPLVQEQRRPSPITRKPLARVPSGHSGSPAQSPPILQTPPLRGSGYQSPSTAPAQGQIPERRPVDQGYGAPTWDRRPSSQMPPVQAYRASQAPQTGQVPGQGYLGQQQANWYQEQEYGRAGSGQYGQGPPNGQQWDSRPGQGGEGNQYQWNQKWSQDRYG